ncbi:protein LSM12-like [Glandiceps talaboti]
MLIKMAAQNDSADYYFKVGSYVACQTCHGQKIEGEVIAFDVQTRMLALKISSASGKSDSHDIHLVNLYLVSNVDLVKEPAETPPLPQPLNLQRLNSRCNQAVEAKRQAVFSVGVDVTPEAQKLFNTIQKTLKCKWQEKNIIVIDEVTIVPPYGPDNCKSKDAQALGHVKKIIEKHIREQHSQQVPGST